MWGETITTVVGGGYNYSGGRLTTVVVGEADYRCAWQTNYSCVRLLNSGTVFKKYKASVEIWWGARIYTKDSGSESAACPPHPFSHTIDMAFGDWSCHLRSYAHHNINEGAVCCTVHDSTGRSLIGEFYCGRFPWLTQKLRPLEKTWNSTFDWLSLTPLPSQQLSLIITTENA
jgi:hypothetical protein